MPEENIHPDVKKRICHYIMGSNFFENQERVYMHQIYNELRSKYKHIYNRLYQKSTDPLISDGQDNMMVYMNSTNLIKVILAFNENDEAVQTVPEFAFLCLARRPQKRSPFEQYFVSREYNVSDSPHNYIAGRFIFKYLDEKIRIHALAEEPATTLSTSYDNVETEYLQRRTENEPSKTYSIYFRDY